MWVTIMCSIIFMLSVFDFVWCCKRLKENLWEDVVAVIVSVVVAAFAFGFAVVSYRNGGMFL